MESKQVPYEAIIFVCTKTRDGGRIACANEGRCGALVRDLLRAEVKARGLKGRVRVSASGCMDLCEEGPNVMVFTADGERIWYKNVSESDPPQILNKRLQIFERLFHAVGRGINDFRMYFSFQKPGSMGFLEKQSDGAFPLFAHIEGIAVDVPFHELFSRL